MHERTADQIRQQVKEAYDEVSIRFDHSRTTDWPEFKGFAPYFRQGDKVLDLGCGNGRLSETLKPYRVDYVGLDNNSVLIDRARARFPEADFLVGDMVSLDLPDRCFDKVFAIAVFHHIPGRALRHKSLSEIHRVLKDDGVLILTVWNMFQWMHLRAWVAAISSSLFHLGAQYEWNDLWIPWRGFTLKRYYHAFLPQELLGYFRNGEWKIEDFYFTRKGSRVKFSRSFNLCLIARKNHGKAD
jgi:tRNA (uracil-5-)-methyltransferase TRM9